MWDVILTGFDSEDQTVNFGTRAVAETNSSVYEATTVATIQAGGEVTQTPEIRAETCEWGGLCLSVDASMTVFKDQSCKDVLFHVTFDSTIESFQTSEDGSYLFVAIEGPDVHCIHIPSGGTHVFSSALLEDEEDAKIVQIFCEPLKGETVHLTLVCSDGKTLRCPNLDLKSISSALSRSATDELDALRESINFVLIASEKEHSPITAVDLCCNDYDNIIAFAGKEIGIKSDFSLPGDLYVQHNLFKRIKTIRIMKDTLFLLALTNDGVLLKICSVSLICLQIWTDLVVKDFISMPWSAEKDQDIILLSQSENDEHSYLMLMSAVTFQVKLRLEVPSNTRLVHLTSDQQEIMYVQWSGGNMPDTIHLKMLVECAPIDRFNRLLRRKKFEEAQRYAQVFNLSMDEVCKGQAKECVSDLCPWSGNLNDTDAELVMSKLVAVLEKIRDDRFVCELCITAAVPGTVHVRQLLRYATKRLASSEDREMSALIVKVHAMECRLETCEIVNEATDFDTWALFSKVNLLEECKRFLSLGELHRASVIWSRHFCEIKCLLTSRVVSSLLGSIPHATPVRALMRWLRHFVPAVLSILPDTFGDVLLWIMHIITALSNRQDWPECGHQCAQEVLDLLNVGETELNLNLYQQYSMPDSALQQFIALMKTIAHLRTLKDKYHLTNVPLEVLMSDDKSQAVQVLLQNVNIMRFGQFASGFLENYVEEWDLDLDMILFEYIETVVLPSNKGWSDYAPWEFLVSTLLAHVKNPEQLLGGILLALKAAPVPWSETIEKLAERGLAFNHPFVEEIRLQKSLVRFKLVLKKYNIKHNAYSEFDNILALMYIRQIIKRNLPGMLEDCLMLCGEDPMLVVNTYYHVFDHFIGQGNEEQAFEMLDSLEKKPKVLHHCLRKIIFLCAEYWDCKASLGNYAEVLSVIKNRLERMDKRCGELEQSLPVTKRCLDELINVQRLHQKANIYMKTSEYACESHRRRVLKSHTITSLEPGDNHPHCAPEELAVLLKLLPEEGILESMDVATDLGFVDKAIAMFEPLKSLNTMSSSVELKMRDVMVRMMATCKTSESFSVAQAVGEVAANACKISVSDKLMDWVKLCEWSRVVTSLSNSWTRTQGNGDDKMTREVDVRKNWSLSPMFFDRSVFADKSSAIALVKDAYVANKKGLTKEMVGAVTAKLHRENNDLTGLAIISSLVHHTNVRKTMLRPLWDDAASKLLVKVLLSQKFDSDLGLTLLFSLSQKAAHAWLKDWTDKSHHDMKRLQLISSLAIVFYKQHYSKAEFDKFSALYQRCIWAKRLMNLGVSAKDAFNLSHTPLQVLNILMRVKQVPFCVIEEFCKAFDIDVSDHMVPLIKVMILAWEPEVQQIENPEGKTTVTIVNNEAELFHQCKVVIEKFEPCSKGMIYEMLESLLTKVNFYYYETFLVVYELMDSVAPKNSPGKDRKFSLNFLRTYRRVCPPERLEVEMWMDVFPDSNGLPPLSKWRLPFRQFLSKDVWPVVKLEVNMDTYETWLRVAPIIGLDRNSVCSVAIRQSIKQVQRTDGTSEDWCLHEKEPYLTSQIQRCVNKLSDPKSATAALFYVINNTPPGADLHALTKLCFAHAKSWIQRDDFELAKECYEKVERKYLDVATSHILFSHGLGLPCYLERKTQPSELITALYNDPSIVARGRKVAMHYPDINEAVGQLADLHHLNLNKILIMQLEECITSKSTKVEWSDETFSETFSPITNKIHDDELHLRACYILQGNSGIAGKFLPYLVTIAWDSSVEEYQSKLQALRCLYAITKESRLEKLTGRKMPAIRLLMQSLRYVVELSRFKILYTVAEFEACAKLDLVKMISQLHGRNKIAVELMVQLCFDFKIFQPEIWDFLLHQLVYLKMDDSLEGHLPRLAGNSPILITAGYVKAWQYLLQIPFNRKDAPLSADQEKLCTKKLELLESCPIVCSLDLLHTADQLLTVGCPHLAAIILPMMTKSLRDVSLKKLLEKFNSAFIVETLRKPDYDNFLTVHKAIKIVEMNNHPSS